MTTPADKTVSERLIIEVRPSKKFEGAWVAFEAPVSSRHSQDQKRSSTRSITLASDLAAAVRKFMSTTRGETVEETIKVDGRDCTSTRRVQNFDACSAVVDFYF